MVPCTISPSKTASTMGSSITLSGSSTVSAATLSAYVAKCEEWLEDRNGGASAAAIFFY